VRRLIKEWLGITEDPIHVENDSPQPSTAHHLTKESSISFVTRRSFLAPRVSCLGSRVLLGKLAFLVVRAGAIMRCGGFHERK
jgi:hypothetical protein